MEASCNANPYYIQPFHLKMSSNQEAVPTSGTLYELPDETTAPNLPPTVPDELVLNASYATPYDLAHAHFHPLPNSQTYFQNPSTDNLSCHRGELLNILNSERWGHHRMVHYLHEEVESTKQEVEHLRNDCDSWAVAWTTCNNKLLHCEADRLNILQENVALRAAIQNLQSTQQILLQEV